MEFEWDEEKREINICHKLDFRDLRPIFDGQPVLTNRSPYQFEERWLTIGKLHEVFITVV